MWEFWDKIILRGGGGVGGGEYKTRKNFNFSEKGQSGNFIEIVQAKTWKFSRSHALL